MFVVGEQNPLFCHFHADIEKSRAPHRPETCIPRAAEADCDQVPPSFGGREVAYVSHGI